MTDKEKDELHVMQLAAIMTASLQNTECSTKDRIHRSSPYWTQAYEDVCRAVDREMGHREEVEQLRNQVKRLFTQQEREESVRKYLQHKMESAIVRAARLEEVVRANHNWHLDYDDSGAYLDSALYNKNVEALGLKEKTNAD